MSHSVVLKILTGGDGGVGKTTLLHRYINNRFLFDTKMTLGVEIFTKAVQIEDIYVMLQLWDFGGQQQFRFMLDSYVMGAKGAIIMFDLTRPTTIGSLDEWINLVSKEYPKMPIMLVGGKADLFGDRMVKDDFLDDIRSKYNFLEYLKTSAKTGDNVDKTFEILTEAIVKKEFPDKF